MRFSGVILACVFVSGCQSTSSTAPPVRFDAQAAQFIHEKGPHRIEGQALFITRDGTPHQLTGETVRLVPATSYAVARFRAFYRGRSSIPAMWIPSVDADRTYASYTRTTRARAGGVFSFDHVAPGTYFVTAQKIYTAKGSFTPEGATMYETVRVSPDQPAVAVTLVGREEGRF
ncbi:MULTISPECIES: carboxypeptidase regulatory-like domain-containing protein [unclassified Beijerinckia]|uniref:carboxypeptidase regulatory-like domain-containing protein n=1 Tax=unclassified Beijerinckia TaxID=2638183 RepID=UPI00089A93B3|nr:MULTISPECIES: carboxypeptidase regulatory-like domain-containing protein [unclassified Beijerinckia]MDH7798473.1 hypothetical protein [Beijerinckia sp. GAS462]SED22062.1 hypothetical protein SAMN05443249_4772 [Beijerinckia sp. 28-YEA-48]